MVKPAVPVHQGKVMLVVQVVPIPHHLLAAVEAVQGLLAVLVL
jgi:hypothetical protein